MTKNFTVLFKRSAWILLPDMASATARERARRRYRGEEKKITLAEVTRGFCVDRERLAGPVHCVGAVIVLKDHGDASGAPSTVASRRLRRAT